MIPTNTILEIETMGGVGFIPVTNEGHLMSLLYYPKTYKAKDEATGKTVEKNGRDLGLEVLAEQGMGSWPVVKVSVLK